MDPEDRKRLKEALKRADSARCQYGVTCPASRHVHSMARQLASGRMPSILIEDPQHCAEPMLAVVAALWEARDRLRRVEGK